MRTAFVESDPGTTAERGAEGRVGIIIPGMSGGTMFDICPKGGGPAMGGISGGSIPGGTGGITGGLGPKCGIPMGGK